jgi:DNA-binding transcriptional MocR family regulator
MILDLRPSDPAPIYRQICDQVVTLVDEGSLPVGAKLPPTRVLARKLGVNRSTICRAYEELWALGYVESRPGSYSTVRERVRRAVPAGADARTAIDWARVGSRAASTALAELPRFRREARTAPGGEVVSFARLGADRGLCPVDALRRALRSALAEGPSVLEYGDPAGSSALRELLARRMRVHGTSVTSDEMMITAGAQHGLDLVLRLLGGQGRTVVIESPSYAIGLVLHKMHGVKLRSVPMRPDGMDLTALERILQRERPAFVYTMPTFQNPTGITTGQPHRERLLALCTRARVPIVEDGFEEEMKYFGRSVLPVKSMDEGGVVIYLGTLSKVVFPGLRIGWVAAASGCIERLVALNRFSSLTGNSLGQAAVAQFCSSGEFETYLRRLHRTHRRRMQVMLASMDQHLPADRALWTRPTGGYTTWVRLPRRAAQEERALLEACRRERVAISPGSLYFAAAPRELCFRLSISSVPEARIEEGCRRLGRALRRLA